MARREKCFPQISPDNLHRCDDGGKSFLSRYPQYVFSPRISDTENAVIRQPRAERSRYSWKTSVRARELENIFIAASSY